LQEEAKILTGDLLSRVHLRKDVLDVMLWQVAIASFEGA
jgi:hypothetical protein